MTNAIPPDVQQAIDDSVTHDAIVTIEWTAGREASLRSLADDYTEGNDVIEYWAAADDLGDGAAAWRVHLDTRWRRLLDEAAAKATRRALREAAEGATAYTEEEESRDVPRFMGFGPLSEKGEERVRRWATEDPGKYPACLFALLATLDAERAAHAAARSEVEALRRRADDAEAGAMGLLFGRRGDDGQ